MKCDSPDYAYLVVDGIENVLAALDDIKQGRLKKCFIEMSICAGSCIGLVDRAQDERESNGAQDGGADGAQI